MTSTLSHYSTASPASGRSAPASATPSPISPTPAKPNNADGELNWSTFFRLRRVRRWHNLVASIFTSSGSTVVAVGILSQFDIDTFGNQVFGLDPILFMGLLTVASGAFGWLAGPSLGNVLFGLRHKRHKAQLDLVSQIWVDLLRNCSKNAAVHDASPSIASNTRTEPRCFGTYRKKRSSTLESNATESTHRRSP